MPSSTLLTQDVLPDISSTLPYVSQIRNKVDNLHRIFRAILIGPLFVEYIAQRRRGVTMVSGLVLRPIDRVAGGTGECSVGGSRTDEF